MNNTFDNEYIQENIQDIVELARVMNEEQLIKEVDNYLFIYKSITLPNGAKDESVNVYTIDDKEEYVINGDKNI